MTMNETIYAGRIITDAPETEGRHVAEEIAQALEASGRFHRVRLEIWSSDRDVRLRGRVSSYYQKQVAQTTAMHIMGDRLLLDEIEVG